MQKEILFIDWVHLSFLFHQTINTFVFQVGFVKGLLFGSGIDLMCVGTTWCKILDQKMIFVTFWIPVVFRVIGKESNYSTNHYIWVFVAANSTGTNRFKIWELQTARTAAEEQRKRTVCLTSITLWISFAQSIIVSTSWNNSCHHARAPSPNSEGHQVRRWLHGQVSHLNSVWYDSLPLDFRNGKAFSTCSSRWLWYKNHFQNGLATMPCSSLPILTRWSEFLIQIQMQLSTL